MIRYVYFLLCMYFMELYYSYENSPAMLLNLIFLNSWEMFIFFYIEKYFMLFYYTDKKQAVKVHFMFVTLFIYKLCELLFIILSGGEFLYF